MPEPAAPEPTTFDFVLTVARGQCRYPRTNNASSTRSNLTSRRNPCSPGPRAPSSGDDLRAADNAAPDRFSSDGTTGVHCAAGENRQLRGRPERPVGMGAVHAHPLPDPGRVDTLTGRVDAAGAVAVRDHPGGKGMTDPSQPRPFLRVSG